MNICIRFFSLLQATKSSTMSVSSTCIQCMGAELCHATRMQKAVTPSIPSPEPHGEGSHSIIPSPEPHAEGSHSIIPSPEPHARNVHCTEVLDSNQMCAYSKCSIHHTNTTNHWAKDLPPIPTDIFTSSSSFTLLVCLRARTN